MCASVSGTEHHNQLVDTMDEVFEELNDLCDNDFEFNDEKMFVDW